MTSAPSSQIRYPQLSKEPLLTSQIGANPINRIWAKALDLAAVKILALMIGLAWKPAWFVVPLVLFALFDRLGRGQSPGKWLLGLHTIETGKGGRPSLYAGLVRNFPFFILVTGFDFKGLAQWFLVFGAMAWIAMEIYFLFNIRSCLRAGDVLSNTRVFDYKDEHTKFIEQFLKEEPTV